MKPITSFLMLAVLTSVLAAQEPPEPYPGQREHRAPPEGWFCSRDAVDRAHWCLCTGMVPNDDPMCRKAPQEPQAPAEDAGDEGGRPVPPEDSKCTVYCHRSHCHCKQFCDT